ncbi:TRAP transporter small permease [Reyranella sp.]|uniref:TRAP transporter small permease n=1 Tax=Reyranella sp. TaxID=1929291 RepID=UPI003BACAD94
MHELAILAAAVVALMAATTVAASLIGRALRRVEVALAVAAAALAFFAMVFVVGEVVMRYGFAAPIPGHLELSELFMPIIVFLGLSYTQATHGHVGMDLALDLMPEAGRRRATIATLLISIFVCAVLAWFSAKNAWQLWVYDDVTMSPPYYKTWPTGAAVALGYGLTALRMYLQVLHLWNPERFPANEPDSGGFHAVE